MNGLQAAQQVWQKLFDKGFQSYLVGGCVRDMVLGIEPKDFDLATHARPEQIAEIFPDSHLVGASFGVVVVPVDGHQIEVCTFRKDGRYVDARHPESVEFGSREDDAKRRDFTINAIYQHPLTFETYDHVGGCRDMNAQSIRCVGKPLDRFNEDALRLLRAIRFAAKTGFQIETDTWNAIVLCKERIRMVSADRILEELTRILTGPRKKYGLHLLSVSGLLKILIPELEKLKGVEQGHKYHPEGDVWNHTLEVMQNLDSSNPIACWAALLHDIGKPGTFSRDPETRKISFKGHASYGSGLAEEVMRRMRASNELSEGVAHVVRRHMCFMDVQKAKKSSLRRLLSHPLIEHELQVHRADSLGSNGDLSDYEFAREKLEALGDVPEARELPPPYVTGDDLIRAGLKPGPIFKVILDRCMDLQLEGMSEHEVRAEMFDFPEVRQAAERAS